MSGETLLPHRIKAKVFFRGPVDPEAVVPIFNRWIRDRTLEDHLLIDIADYRHVPDGPSVILVGHEADIAIDHGDGRPGLAYIRKRDWPDAEGEADALRARIQTALTWLVRAAAELELPTEPGEFQVWFQDRLFTRQPDLEPALAEAVRHEIADLLGDAAVEVEAIDADSRRAVGFAARSVQVDPEGSAGRIQA